MSDLCYKATELDGMVERLQLMERMSSRAGSDRAALEGMDRGETAFGARMRCLACARESECRVWLALGSADVCEAGFCPNVGTFLACR